MAYADRLPRCAKECSRNDLSWLCVYSRLLSPKGETYRSISSRDRLLRSESRPSAQSELRDQRPEIQPRGGSPAALLPAAAPGNAQTRPARSPHSRRTQALDAATRCPSIYDPRVGTATQVFQSREPAELKLLPLASCNMPPLRGRVAPSTVR